MVQNFLSKIKNKFSKVRVQKDQRGFIIEEFLILAVLAGGVGGFGMAVTIPSNPNKDIATLIVSKFKSIENANIAFYEKYHFWPNQVTDGDWANNAAALVTKKAIDLSYRLQMLGYAPFVEDFSVSAENTMWHNIDGGGLVSQHVTVGDDGQKYMEIDFDNIKADDAYMVDLRIDKSYTPDSGIVTIDYTNNKDKDRVNLKYRANLVS